MMEPQVLPTSLRSPCGVSTVNDFQIESEALLDSEKDGSGASGVRELYICGSPGAEDDDEADNESHSSPDFPFYKARSECSKSVDQENLEPRELQTTEFDHDSSLSKETTLESMKINCTEDVESLPDRALKLTIKTASRGAEQSSRGPKTATGTPKACAKKSFVWKYFHHPELASGITDRSRTQCILCDSQLAFNASGTTTTMLNHLKSRHGDIAEQEELQRRVSRPKGGNTRHLVADNRSSNEETDQLDTPGDLQRISLSGNRHSRSPIGQRGRPPVAVRRQKLTKNPEAMDYLSQTSALQGCQLKSDGGSMFPVVTITRALKDSSPQCYEKVDLRTTKSLSALGKDSIVGANGNDQRKEVGALLPGMNLVGVGGHKFDAVTDAALSCAANKMFSTPLFPRNSLLNAVSAFSNGAFGIPLPGQINCPAAQELSPSSSSGLGVSVSSPVEPTTTSASPTNSTDNRSVTSPTHLSHRFSQANQPIPFHKVSLTHEARPITNGHVTDVIGTRNCLVSSPVATTSNSFGMVGRDGAMICPSGLQSQANVGNVASPADLATGFIDPASVLNLLTNSAGSNVNSVGPLTTNNEVHASSNLSLPVGSLVDSLQSPSQVTRSLLDGLNQWTNSSQVTPNMNASGLTIASLMTSHSSPTVNQSQAQHHLQSSSRLSNEPQSTFPTVSLEHMVSNSPTTAKYNNMSGNSVNLGVSMNSLDLSTNNGFRPRSGSPQVPTLDDEEMKTGQASEPGPASSTKRKRARPNYISPHCEAKRRVLEHVSSTDTEDSEATDMTNKPTEHLLVIPEVSRASSAVNQVEQQISKPERNQVTQTTFLHNLIRYLVKDMQPPEIVEGEGFKSMIGFLTGCQLPSAERLRAELLPRLVKEARDNTVLRLTAHSEAYSVSLDQGKANQNMESGSAEDNLQALAFSVEIWPSASRARMDTVGDIKFVQGSAVHANLEVHRSSLRSSSLQSHVYDSIKAGLNLVGVQRVLHRTKRGLQRKNEQLPDNACYSNQNDEKTSSEDRNERLPSNNLIDEVQVAENATQPSSNEEDIPKNFQIESVCSSWAQAYHLIQSASDTAVPTPVSDDKRVLQELRHVLELLNQTLELIHRRDLVLTASMMEPLLQNLCQTHLASAEELPQDNSEDPSRGTNVVEQFKSIIRESLMQAYPEDAAVRETLQLASLLDPRFKDHSEGQKPSVVSLLREKLEAVPTSIDCTPKQQNFSTTDPSPISAGGKTTKPSSDTTGLRTVFGLQCFARTSLSEVDRYLREEPLGLEENPFAWWSEKVSTYPRLAILANYYLTIPLTSFAVGRLTSLGSLGQDKPNETHLYEPKDGLGLPNIVDPLGRNRVRIAEDDQATYNFLWHNLDKIHEV
ncbi:BED zinc finger [Opisthorchis viverrini]|uniref:BED zinc finger n=1 Tax=Opisthorchis viverrini TaxID=6198 RepID=A0A1S8XB34_OPIVI|nr:BED zinc finger [Opisthorchis viverrini]